MRSIWKDANYNVAGFSGLSRVKPLFGVLLDFQENR